LHEMEEVAAVKLNPLDELRVARVELEVIRKQIDPDDSRLLSALRNSEAMLNHMERAMLALPGRPDEMKIETDVGIEHIRWLVFRGERVFKVEMLDACPWIAGTWFDGKEPSNG
jgi:hypothetical protein